jgi:cobyrinic acid a,c-diamide synthase
MRLATPRLVVAGLAGDSGKTLVSLGLTGALARRGLEVAPFKKGPDYIDAGWLEQAAGRSARNLDTYMMGTPAIAEALRRSGSPDLILVEGNRGLHDGVDAAGSQSSGELAKLLRSPVLLVVDVTKMTRTAAALVLGVAKADPEVALAGVILNRVATARQERVIRDAIQELTGLPVHGAVPRLEGEDPLPGRHLGLVTAAEHPSRRSALDRSREVVAENVDLDAVVNAARSAPAVELPDWVGPVGGDPVTIGVLRDAAFSFYYPENLEALEQAGARLVFVSPLADVDLPRVDALYMGGGFPEVHAQRLAENRSMLNAVREAAVGGMPIYAECGGLMYLSRELVVDTFSYPMAGVLDLVVEHTPKPTGHGYVVAEVRQSNPFFATGMRLTGHEFHYSRVVKGEHSVSAVLDLERGRGIGDGLDGLVVGRVWASYLHLHALGTPSWAESLTGLARDYRSGRVAASAAWG